MKKSYEAAVVAAMAVVGAFAFVGPSLAAGDFDGKYAFKSTKCTPSGSYRFSALTVKDSKFTFNFTKNNIHKDCSTAIKPDGSFENKSCGVPMSGKFSGNQLELHFKTDDAFCDTAATRG